MERYSLNFIAMFIEMIHAFNPWKPGLPLGPGKPIPPFEIKEH